MKDFLAYLNMIYFPLQIHYCFFDHKYTSLGVFLVKYIQGRHKDRWNLGNGDAQEYSASTAV